MEKPLVIIGSARPSGDTRELVRTVLGETNYALIDLLDYFVAPYNYSHSYPPDDAFLPLARRMLQHPVLVLATPVYWYSMSALLKTFFDRLTDLTTIHKALGRQLAGHHVFLLATGSDPALPAGFEVPFQLTAAYFAMTYAGSFYQSTKQPFAAAEALAFRTRIQEAALQ